MLSTSYRPVSKIPVTCSGSCLGTEVAAPNGDLTQREILLDQPDTPSAMQALFSHLVTVSTGHP